MSSSNSGRARRQSNGFQNLPQALGDERDVGETDAVEKPMTTDEKDEELEQLRRDPVVKKLLDTWWKSALEYLDTDGNGTIERSEYLRLYERLLYGTSKLQNCEIERLGNTEELMETDWQRDSNGRVSIDCDRFQQSIFELAYAWSSEASANEMEKFLRSLHELVFIGYEEEQEKARKEPDYSVDLSSSDVSVSDSDEDGTRPREMIDTPRSLAFSSTEIEIEAGVKLDAPTPPAPPEPPSLETVSGPERMHSSGAHLHIDTLEAPTLDLQIDTEPAPGSSGLEALDKRYAELQHVKPLKQRKPKSPSKANDKFLLRDRLVACQKQLPPLVIQAEICYLRYCSSDPADLERRHEVTEAAKTVCLHLTRALQLAKTPTDPQFRLCIKRTEASIDTFEALIRVSAHSRNPQKISHEPAEQIPTQQSKDIVTAILNNTAPASSSKNAKAVDEKKQVSDRVAAYRNRPIEYDLPSMKAYHEKAPPPASVYRAQNTRHRRKGST